MKLNRIYQEVFYSAQIHQQLSAKNKCLNLLLKNKILFYQEITKYENLLLFIIYVFLVFCYCTLLNLEHLQ